MKIISIPLEASRFLLGPASNALFPENLTDMPLQC